MLIPQRISVVVPVYNSEQSLPILIDRLDRIRESLGSEFETILVNDGSPDRSADIMRDLSLRYSWVRSVFLLRNYGQHNALLCGIREARHEVIVTMDDDLQNPPEEVWKLLTKLRDGYDVVYGYPERESHGAMRDLASRITKLALQRVVGADVARHVSSFRAFRTEIRDAFRNFDGSFVSIDVLLGWGTTRFTAIPVKNPPRQLGKSNYSFSKLLVHALNMITGFTTLPLQFASILGFLFASFGFVLLVYVIGRYFIEGHSVPGFPFLASILSMFSGVQLFALGVIGEYLARMHFRLMNRPSYAKRQSLSRDEPASM